MSYSALFVSIYTVINVLLHNVLTFPSSYNIQIESYQLLEVMCDVLRNTDSNVCVPDDCGKFIGNFGIVLKLFKSLHGTFFDLDHILYHKLGVCSFNGGLISSLFITICICTCTCMLIFICKKRCVRQPVEQ